LSAAGRPSRSWSSCRTPGTQDVTEVCIQVEPVRGRALARLVVEDDDPAGFSDLAHAYTLFAESEKKSQPHKRGRFNLGEKLVLAMCAEASIETTTGTVVFDEAGRRHYPRRKRERGSKFEGLLRMTRDELSDVENAVQLLIPPSRIRTTFNEVELLPRTPIAVIEATLPTELADGEGYLRATRRRTFARVHEAVEGESARLFELGIPVVETDDQWDVDIQQKIPLNTDRDNVTPAYLREVRALVLNHMHAHLDEKTARDGWVSQALESPDINAGAVGSVLTSRYGDKRVIADPSDPEGTKLAVSRGYAVIQSGSFSRRQWQAIRASGAALPAGQVTPSPKPYSTGPGRPDSP
jgi:hypothetical protein